MLCPKCSGDTRVLDSRYLPNAVRRRRECLECGHRFTTKELEVDRLNRLLEAAAVVRAQLFENLDTFKNLIETTFTFDN